MTVAPETADSYQLQQDHAGRAVDQLHTWLQTKQRVVAVVRGLAAGAQRAEDQFWELLTSDMPEVATGATLTRWGRLVGQDRGTLSDEDYRRVIQAAVLANRCPGDGDSLLRIWQILTAATATRLVETFVGGGATFTLYARRESPLSDSMRTRVVALMQIAKPAGVSMALVETVGPRPLMGFFTSDTEGTLDAAPLARVL